MDMSFSPKDWPQLGRDSRISAESRHESLGPEWHDLLARLDAAHDSRTALNDADEGSQKGSFSPHSADRIEALSAHGNEDDPAVNLADSAIRNAASSEKTAQTGNALPGEVRE